MPSLEGMIKDASIASIAFWSMAQSGGPKTHPEWENDQESWLRLFQKLPGLLMTGSAWSAFGQAPKAAAPILCLRADGGHTLY